ncbi:MAG: 2-oxoacid:acceptor oxidoreductase family protein [Candidatus Hodarchaeota archaeon]
MFKIPASKFAKELQNEKVANMIMLGALIKVTKIVSKEAIIKSISDTVSEKYIELNVKAIEKGFEFFN